MSLSPYGFSAALHALVLAAACWLAVLMIRRPRPRAAAALLFMAAIGLAPWLSFQTTPPAQPSAPAAATARLGREIVRLPQWTVATLPAEPQDAYAAAPLSTAPKASPATTAPVSPVSPATTPPRGLSLQQYAGLIWYLGCLAGVFILLSNAVRMAVWMSRLSLPCSGEWSLIRRLVDPSLERTSFLVSHKACSPCVAGWMRPVVVLPASLLEDGREQELHWALRHEICHLRAHDSRWIWLISAVRIVYWWNPFVHALASQWAAARERVCDLAAAVDDSERSGYGRFLVEMAGEVSHRPSMSVSIVRSKRMRVLRHRIVSLLNARATDHQAASRPFRIFTLAGLAAAVTALSGLTIAEDQPSSPSTESAPPKAAPAREISRTPLESGTEWTLADRKVPGLDRSDVTWSDDPFTPIPRTLALSDDLKGDTPPARQALSRFAVVYSPLPLEEDRTVIKASEYEAFRTKLSADPSIIIAEFPTLTARNGEQALVEIISEVILPKDNDRDFYTLNLGWMLHFNTSFEGGAVRLKTNVDFGYIPGRFQPSPYLRPTRPPQHELVKVTYANGKAGALLEPGDLLLTSMGKVDGVSYATIVAEAHEVDATGRPVKALPQQKVPAAAKVKLSGTIATYDLSPGEKKIIEQGASGRAADSLSNLDLSSSPPPRLMTQSKDLALKAQNAAKEIERLDPAILNGGETAQPWKSLDLSLKTSLSPSFLKIQPAIGLALPTPETFPVQDYEPSFWVIELPAEAQGTRRLLYVTAEPVP